jgi:hypothetical protein
MIGPGKSKPGVCRCGYGKSLHFETRKDSDSRPLAVRGITCRDYYDSQEFAEFIGYEDAIEMQEEHDALDYEDDLFEGDGSVYLD